MAITLTFNHPLNISVNIGDVAFHAPTSTNVYDISTAYETIGVITDIIDRNTNLSKIIIDPPLSTPVIGDFIFFAKSNQVNSSGLKGYYAEVRLENWSTEKVELFSIGSEVSESSK